MSGYSRRDRIESLVVPATARQSRELIGQSIRRREDERFVTGRGTFLDDVHPSGLLHGVFLRSPYAHARLLSLDLEAARSMPVEHTPIPPLCTLVVASAFDAAIHDAFGKLLGTNCYRTYGPDCIGHDLSRYLDAQFQGEYLNQYLTEEPRPCLHLYHLVGALDPLIAAAAGGCIAIVVSIATLWITGSRRWAIWCGPRRCCIARRAGCPAIG